MPVKKKEPTAEKGIAIVYLEQEIQRLKDEISSVKYDNSMKTSEIRDLKKEVKHFDYTIGAEVTRLRVQTRAYIVRQLKDIHEEFLRQKGSV